MNLDRKIRIETVLRTMFARTYALDILREQKQRRDRYRGDTCTHPSRAVVARHAAGVLADRGHAGP